MGRDVVGEDFCLNYIYYEYIYATTLWSRSELHRLVDLIAL